MLAEHNRVLDAQDAKRQAEKDARVEKQKKLMELMEDTVVAGQNAQRDADAQRADKQKDEADRRTMELQRNKEALLKKTRHDTQDFLRAQMQQKDSRKQTATELKKMQVRLRLIDVHQTLTLSFDTGSSFKKFQIYC